MFKIATSPEFTHTVRVQVPVDGGHEEQTFDCRFRVVDDPDEKSLLAVDGVKQFLRDIIVSFDDLADAQGKPVSYSDAVRDRILALPNVRLALLRTYRNALSKAQTGN